MIVGIYFCNQCSINLPIDNFFKTLVEIVLMKKLNAIVVVKNLLVAVYQNF